MPREYCVCDPHRRTMPGTCPGPKVCPLNQPEPHECADCGDKATETWNEEAVALFGPKILMHLCEACADARREASCP
ncbi:MAG: hypothetical protein FJ271_31300 [Planctomycetes bacterium]|nr:hypothetical protein [Planctomycetota bacterium]